MFTVVYKYTLVLERTLVGVLLMAYMKGSVKMLVMHKVGHDVGDVHVYMYVCMYVRMYIPAWNASRVPGVR